MEGRSDIDRHIDKISATEPSGINMWVDLGEIKFK